MAFFCCSSFAQVLIKNVNVIDVEKKKVLAGYNVVALDGKIVSINKGRTYKLPEGTEVIDGTGKYLVPGFTDAHVHFSQSGGLYTRPDAMDLRKYVPYAKEIAWTHDHLEDFLRRYTAAGITSVIDVGTTMNFLAQRDTFTNKSYAPVITMTGPLLTTYIPAAFKDLGRDAPFMEMKTEEQSRQAVRDQLKNKADFIKIWYIVLDRDKEAGARKNLPLVKAVIDEAHKNNLRVAVHATERITAQLAVEAGADLLVHNIEDEVIQKDFTDLLRSRNTVLSPTLVVGGNYGKVFGNTYKFSPEELALAHPVTAGSIMDYPRVDTTLGKAYIRSVHAPANMAAAARRDSISIVNLKKLYEAGVIIATGTDAGNTGTQHVSSYFIELKAMQDAGLNMWDLLVASTINGAKAAGQQLQWGSLTENKVANMVLLNANPLDSLANWRKIDWVINKGRPFKPDSLVLLSPEIIAQQQLNAYNTHDLEAFLEAYADDVEIFDLPGKSIMKGKDDMRKNYAFLRTTPKLHCRLLNRIVQGNMVIDHEEVWGFGSKPFYGVAIYIIEKGKISKVYFSK
jgi:imidazolonepropionase-like amidohydrolase